MTGRQEVERLKASLGCRTDLELATLLGVSRSTVVSWARRGSIPRRYLEWATLSPGDVATLRTMEGLTEQMRVVAGSLEAMARKIDEALGK